MTTIKSPANILYEKEWRAAYGNRCNAIFLSILMRDYESMRKLFHDSGDTHKTTPLARIFWEYYKDHDKEKMLDRVKAATTDKNGYPLYQMPFSVDEKHGKRTLRDWSVQSSFWGGNKESPWADLKNYEQRATLKITDEFCSRQSVYYDNKSVAEVLKETVEKTTFLEKQITHSTGNQKLDLLVNNLQNQRDENFHLQTYVLALKQINNDLISAFEKEREPLDADTYVPVVIMLDELSAKVFNQMDYKQQRTFHKSDLGQEMLRFSYLTTQNLCGKDEAFDVFSANNMNMWLNDIKKTDLWQVAQNKIAKDITERWSHRVRVGSLLNNRMLELATIKPKPKEAMYADYWEEDKKRTLYMNLYTASPISFLKQR